MAKEKRYGEMTVAELETESQKLTAEREEIKQRQKEVNRLLSDKAPRINSDRERKDLAQIIQPKEVDTKVDIGKI